MKNCQCMDSVLTPPMLIGQVARLHYNRMRAQDKSNIVMSQNSCRLLLLHLSFNEGVTQLDLVKSTKLKPPTVSVSLKHLESEGYVSRVADENDMRSVRVYLTEKGKQLMQDNEMRLKRLDAQMMEGFSEEEKKVLYDMLLRVRDNLVKEETQS